MKNKLFNMAIALGGVFCLVPMFAQSANKTLITRGAPGLQSLSGTVKIHTHLIVLLLFLVLLCFIILCCLIYGKNKRKKRHQKEPDLAKKVRDIEQKLRRQNLQADHELSDLKHKISNIQIQVELLKKMNSSHQVIKNTDVIQSKPQAKPAEQIQYLKAGDDDDFFYGSERKNSDGCQFEISFQSKKNGEKGKLTVLTDIENLKSISPKFFKRVIHIKNNVSLKEARGLTVVSTGLCEYKLDGSLPIWKIIHPIDVLLNK